MGNTAELLYQFIASLLGMAERCLETVHSTLQEHIDELHGPKGDMAHYFGT